MRSSNEEKTDMDKTNMGRGQGVQTKKDPISGMGRTEKALVPGSRCKHYKSLKT